MCDRLQIEPVLYQMSIGDSDQLPADGLHTEKIDETTIIIHRLINVGRRFHKKRFQRTFVIYQLQSMA